MFVAAGFALWAVFVPMRPLAPATWRPLVAPLFIRLRAWSLRISRFRFAWFVSRRVAAHGESVRRIGARFNFAPNVSHFHVAEYTASCAQRES
eukprot:874754-Pleurochrysis_carterae.AAC.1